VEVRSQGIGEEEKRDRILIEPRSGCRKEREENREDGESKREDAEL